MLKATLGTIRFSIQPKTEQNKKSQQSTNEPQSNPKPPKN